MSRVVLHLSAALVPWSSCQIRDRPVHPAHGSHTGARPQHDPKRKNGFKYTPLTDITVPGHSILVTLEFGDR